MRTTIRAIISVIAALLILANVASAEVIEGFGEYVDQELSAIEIGIEQGQESVVGQKGGILEGWHLKQLRLLIQGTFTWKISAFFNIEAYPQLEFYFERNPNA